ncbi:MAG: hypothetical protein HOE69_04725 [Euryarchaeota archaeon]|mgnify:FL=1|nr:hypothetical protein [Euryarchaeota archaeon]
MPVRDFDLILGRDSIFEFMAKGLAYAYTDAAVSENPSYASWSGAELAATTSTELFMMGQLGYSRVRDAPGKHGLYLWLLQSNRADMPHVIAFRGSEEFLDDTGISSDWEADLIDSEVGYRQIYGLPGQGDNIGLIQEFYDEAAALPGFDTKGLCVTGHSLGGALAQRFAADSRWWAGVTEIVTFQAPGVGSPRLQHWQEYTGSVATVRHHISGGDVVHMSGGPHLRNGSGSFYYHLHNSLSSPLPPHCVTLLCCNPIHSLYPANGDLPIAADGTPGFNLMSAYGSSMTTLRSENSDSEAWIQLDPYDGTIPVSTTIITPSVAALLGPICTNIQSLQTANGRRNREPLILSSEAGYSTFDRIMSTLSSGVALLGLTLPDIAEPVRRTFGTATNAAEGAWDALTTRVEQSGGVWRFVVDVVSPSTNLIVAPLVIDMASSAHSRVNQRSNAMRMELAEDARRAQQQSGFNSGGGGGW